VWVDLPGEGDGASRKFRQRGPNPREVSQTRKAEDAERRRIATAQRAAVSP
jgi:hypothetical protein